jgi:hypothetical protein
MGWRKSVHERYGEHPALSVPYALARQNVQDDDDEEDWLDTQDEPAGQAGQENTQDGGDEDEGGG